MSRRTRLILSLIGISMLSTIVVGTLAMKLDGPQAREYSFFVQSLDNMKKQAATSTVYDRGHVDNTQGRPDAHLTLSDDPSQAATLSASEITYYSAAGDEYISKIPSLQEVSRLLDERGYTNWHDEFSPSAGSVLLSILPTLFFIGLLIYLFRMLKSGGMSGMGLGKSKAKLMAEHPGVTFADVAGCDEAIMELGEVVSVLKNPAKFAEIGARTPRGVLLVGPPGTGKTLLARAVAGEAGVAFFSVSGSEFVEMFVGVGAARVRDLFAQARRAGKAIIFIDEIDAVGRHRGSGMGNGNDEREQTLNQLLVEMDGFENTSPIIVMAATNRPDILDKALMRPGRFDRQVTVDSPDLKGRGQILEIHARNRPVADDVDLSVIARQTPGFSGADLANLLNEAALLAARASRKVITLTDLEDASLRVIAGPERVNGLLSDAERKVVAYHEMGHALVGHVLPNAHPVHKISIVSRGRALGFTMQLPERDQVLRKRSELTDQLAGLLAGRMAEEIVFGPEDVTSGAADDIEKATKIAHTMVTQLGMSPLGLRAFLSSEVGEPRTYSEEMASHVDAEVDHLLSEAQARAREVLEQRRSLLDALALRLLEVETMDRDDLVAIIDGFPVAAAPTASVVRLHPRRHDVPRPRSGGWLLPEKEPVAVSSNSVAALTPVAAPMRRDWFGRTASALLRLASGDRVRS
jgi:cell division protease FtsH